MASVPSLPADGTQNGNVFNDRDNANLLWYLPVFAPVDPTSTFGFAASEANKLDQNGNPFFTAALTVAIQPVDPPDLASARQANPTATFQMIPPTGVDASLLVPYKDATGADQTTTVGGQVTPQGDGSLAVSFTGLLGPTVVQAYTALTQLGGMSVQIGFSYDVWRRVLRRAIDEPQSRPPLIPNPILLSQPAELPIRPIEPAIPLRQIPIGPLWPPPTPVWMVAPAGTAIVCPLQLTFAPSRYRPGYTVTLPDGTTRTIIDVNDLTGFGGPRSEYRQLTELGDITTKYPSFERVYLGQVSGTVIAIPVAYGIVRSSAGCAARIDALVDTSPSSLSGCRFRFTLEVAPVVDPIDWAQLSDDLMTIPEARNATLRLALPGGIDPRVTGTFSATVSNLTYANAPASPAILMSFEITDLGATPALVNVNLLLGQFLAGTSTPLFGQIGARLDDVFTPPVQAVVLMNVHSTSGADELGVTIADTPPTVTAVNRGPLDLLLLRMRTTSAQGVQVDKLNDVLPANQSLALPVSAPGVAESVVFQRTLALPSPVPPSALGRYVEIYTQTVQQTQHALIINGSSIDFAVEGIARLDIQIALTGLPTVPVPVITLEPSRQIDSAQVVVPIGAALTGLEATLAISVRTIDPANNRAVEVTNDFTANPIFVLTKADVDPQRAS